MSHAKAQRRKAANNNVGSLCPTEGARYELIGGILRPLQNVQFCSSSRKVKILTTGIYWIFRGLKFETDPRGIGFAFHRAGAEIGQKGDVR